MQSATTQISDTVILSLIKESNPKGWDVLYDKYAAVMYGVICTQTADKAPAEEILINLFIQLKHEDVLLKVNSVLSVCILRYTHCNTRRELKRRGINYTETLTMGNSVLDLLCSQYIDIKEVAAKLRVTEKELKRNLHKEFLMLRYKNRYTQPIQQEEGSKEDILLYN